MFSKKKKEPKITAECSGVENRGDSTRLKFDIISNGRAGSLFLNNDNRLPDTQYGDLYEVTFRKIDKPAEEES